MSAASDNSFEDSVHNMIQYMIQSDRLRLLPTQAKLFRKKPYFAPKRNANITFDLAIELWPPRATSYSLLWLCQFKHSNRPVSLNEIEDFKDKMDLLGIKNVKGVIASADAVEHEVLDYARTNGIGLIRILPNERVRWLIEKANTAIEPLEEKANPREITMGLTSQNHTGQNHNIFTFYDGYVFDNLNDFLIRMFKK